MSSQRNQQLVQRPLAKTGLERLCIRIGRIRVTLERWIGSDRRGDLTDTCSDRILGHESQTGSDLREAHAVISGIDDLVLSEDLGVANLAHDCGGEILDAVVEVVPAHVEDLTRYLSGRRLQSQHERSSCIAAMDIGPPGLTAN